MTKKQNKKDKLTLKQRKFIRGLAEGLTIAEAGRQAGYSDGTLKGEIYRTAENRRIRAAIKDIMEQMGLTDGQLLKALKNGLDANKVISFNKNSNSKKSVFLEIPDFASRHKFLTIALYLQGHLTVKKKI